VIEHFFAVGAQRSGTTYLYYMLDEHPQIEMAKPMRPEPKFFMQDVFLEAQPEDYERIYFGSKPGVKFRGEKTASYIESPLAAERIARWYPDAKILFLLREPVARAISNYQFSASNGLETLSLDEAIRTEDQRREDYDHDKISASPYAYLKRGIYIDYIGVFEQFFKRDNLIILIYEEFVEQLASVQNLYATLGAATDFVPPSLNEDINVSEKAVINLMPDLEKFMVDYFADANAQLETYLGRKITAWVR
jgi:Sulfotransferase domain